MGASLMTTDADEEALRDTGVSCGYDGETIEYLDGVMVAFMVKPYIQNGVLTFFDVMTEDEDDYLYEPQFFHAKNWDEIEEQFQPYIEDACALNVEGAITRCHYCGSGILPGETTGVITFGEILRSHRNPDLLTFGNSFQNMDRDPRIVCIGCMLVINRDVHEIWDDTVSHDDECEEGTAVRCWRDGCSGNCENKMR